MHGRRSRARGWLLAATSVVDAGAGVPPRRIARRAASLLGRARRPLGRRWLVLLLLAALILGTAANEIRTSALQARLFSALDHHLRFHVAPGPSPLPAAPPEGPYDVRLGYSRIPVWVTKLSRHGFRVTEQARLSPLLQRAVSLGITPPYHEPRQTGLRILDRDGRILFLSLHPDRVYPDFEGIPRPVVNALLFIENRELLDAPPRQNPAVEWDRLAHASIDLLRAGLIGGGREHRPGGSTLATQLEKFRHSAGGLTSSPLEKLRQMVSASLWAYQDGESTLSTRREIVLYYLDSLPLAARPGKGEVVGLAAGLEAWYGADFDGVNALLSAPWASQAPARLAEQARAYRQVLSLLLATRRPSTYLRPGSPALSQLTDATLRRLTAAGVIPERVRDAALAARTEIVPPQLGLDPDRTTGEEPVRPVRRRLVSDLGLRGYYALDRLDLEADSTLDAYAQKAVSRYLHSLRSARTVTKDGLRGRGLIGSGNPADIVYSFALYERKGDVNLLRVEADTFDGGFDVHEDTKLDLGSTAKLRVLATYLQTICTLHDRMSGATLPELRQQARHADPLTSFVARWELWHRSGSIDDLLTAAMQRRYSADPGEAFFTGGGIHRFRNFDREEDDRVYTVAGAFEHSVNLVFIRLMRDLVANVEAGLPGHPLTMLEDPRDPRRRPALERFAMEEGRSRLLGLYREHAGVAADDWIRRWISSAHPTPRKLAIVLRSVEPEAGLQRFEAALRELPAARDLPDANLRSLYVSSDPARLRLSDRGYLTGIHPLEIWLLGWLHAHPGASWDRTLAASGPARLESFRWLFATRDRGAQDRRLRILIEREAFARIHADWKRLGYPFDSLVPSYATAIGSSADRPSALAKLLGIISSGGIRYPVRRIRQLRFGPATPYETALAPPPGRGERVMRPQVARALRRVLQATVAGGTARRAAGSLVADDGHVIPLGGKTGTGDNEFKTVDRQGRVIHARPVSRAATFIFLFGDRFFGVLTAYVSGPESGSYAFTSSLPVQAFAELGPVLARLDTGPTAPPPRRPPPVRRQPLRRPPPRAS